MKKHRQVATLTRYLRDAINMAAHWRGERHPVEYPEFDAEIEKIRAALRELASLARQPQPRSELTRAELNLIQLRRINDSELKRYLRTHSDPLVQLLLERL